MKTRVLVIILLILLLGVVLTQTNNKLLDILLSFINPVKQTYTQVTTEVGDKSQSFVYQKETIQKLNRENKILRKLLLEQKHYISQVSDLYTKIPSLERMPQKSVDIVQTISYVKLNTFSQVILTKPLDFNGTDGKFYGLIQDGVAAGVAEVYNNNLYGTLVSNKKCRFMVLVGKERAAGIAIGGDKEGMVVKFIPKWFNIAPEDVVVTSGLDTIFFANIPVGVVKKVEIESSYKVVYIKPYADILHPNYFYLIKDTSVTLASKYDGKYYCSDDGFQTKKDTNLTSLEGNITSANHMNLEKDANATLTQINATEISSIPSVLPETAKSVIQTSDDEVSADQIQPPEENQPKQKPKPKPKPKVENLDMF